MRPRVRALARTVRRFLSSQPPHHDPARRLYEDRDYLDAYSAHTDQRVDEDPHSAVGGMWDELGELQFRFLVRMGLTPASRLLDIGCGTLRGGRHFIRYLEAERYTGIDLSPRAIAFGHQLVAQEGLAAKRPRLLVNERKDLRFTEFTGEAFDFILAQSVFTHLPPEPIEECLAHVGGILTDDGRFFFTYNDSPESARTGLKDFRHPFSFFQALADRFDLELQDLSDVYKHPRGQRMVKVIKGNQHRATVTTRSGTFPAFP